MEPEVLEVLARRYRRSVERAVRTVLRDDADVEDAVQQAYANAFDALPRFAGRASLRTWVTRIAVNEALSRTRLARREPRVEGLLDTVAAPGTCCPERAAASREALSLVWRALLRLPAEQRELFRLRHVEELSVAETAARLGTTSGAVKLRLHRARWRLRRMIRHPGDGPFGDRRAPGTATGDDTEGAYT